MYLNVRENSALNAERKDRNRQNSQDNKNDNELYTSRERTQEMKDMFKKYTAVWAIFVAVFNVIIFAIPSEIAGMTKTGGAFYSSYIMIMLAFIGQLICAKRAFKENDADMFFLKVPLVTISYIALILSIAAGTVCMLIPDLPNWVGVIICVLILGFNASAVVQADTAADVISDVEQKTADKTVFMKQLKAEAEILSSRSMPPEIKIIVKKVCEAIRYSDPVSDVSLADIENDIKRKFDEFAALATGDSDIERLKSMQQELIMMINDRNKLCKSHKK